MVEGGVRYGVIEGAVGKIESMYVMEDVTVSRAGRAGP